MYITVLTATEACQNWCFKIILLVSSVEVVLPFRVETFGWPHPLVEIWYLLGVLFRISDEHLRHSYREAPPPPRIP